VLAWLLWSGKNDIRKNSRKHSCGNCQTSWWFFYSAMLSPQLNSNHHPLLVRGSGGMVIQRGDWSIFSARSCRPWNLNFWNLDLWRVDLWSPSRWNSNFYESLSMTRQDAHFYYGWASQCFGRCLFAKHRANCLNGCRWQFCFCGQ